MSLKTNICVSVSCDYEDIENGGTSSSSGSEYYNVIFQSKEDYLECSQEFSKESLFANIMESIKQSSIEYYETQGKILSLDCSFNWVRTELDEGFEDFDKSDFDPIVLKDIDGIIYVS